ncbi:hypothetical protein AGMMS49975_14340 [Clostridia bacterium]|nr:hypothetical protein AGMMS49975_14340 [Clostridia bacterium]
MMAAENSSVSIYLDGEETNEYSATIQGSPTSSVSSVVSNVRVVVTGAYGYALSLNSGTTNMVGQNSSSNILSPIASATIQTPRALRRRQ